MKILAIDSSGMVASAAVVTEDTVLAEFNTDFRKTHSETLLPMIDSIMKMTETDVRDLDAVAVAKGPGSFTGLRIGSATAKGLALAADKPIIEISTLEAMAYQLYGTENIICPMMDARRHEVYYGVYRFEGEKLVQLIPDGAAPAADVIEKLNDLGKNAVLTGDGVPVNEAAVREKLKVPYLIAKPFQNRQRAAALGILAVEYAKENRFVSTFDHAPVYLRVSQAERERAERLKKQN